MARPMGKARSSPLRIEFGHCPKLANHGSKFTPGAGLAHEAEHWSLTTLCETQVRIGAKATRQCRYVAFQLVESAIPSLQLAEILQQMAGLRPRPAPS